MNILSSKFKSVFFAVIPVILIVIFYNFFINTIEINILTNFFISCFVLIVGLTFFLIGVDIGITPFGNLTGEKIAKKNKIYLLIVFGLILGFVISIAEPSLLVLSEEISVATSRQINTMTLVYIASIGLAISTVIGLLRIVFNIPLHLILFIMYLIIFVLLIFADLHFLSISFDISGATTGVLSVPFILALGRGITLIKKDSKSSEKDSFGLISILSAGVIIAVLIYSFFVNIDSINVVEEINNYKMFYSVFKETVIIFLPLFIIFNFMNLIYFKLNFRNFKRILFGFIYSFIGLLLFLFSINFGFMDMGFFIGESLSNINSYLILLFSFFMGFVVILAEPAIYILVSQIEEVTGGYINRKIILFSISVGVGIAILISVYKIMNPNLELWHILLSGYLIAIILNYITPKLFVGISFDAGGVATGPMIVTFILPFIMGLSTFLSNNSILSAFGMISLVALFPIITVQILGIVFKIKSRKEINNE
jgi:hypothetical protein